MTTTVADRTPAAAPEYGVVAKLASEAFGAFLLVFGALGVALFSNPSAAPIPTPLAVASPRSATSPAATSTRR